MKDLKVRYELMTPSEIRKARERYPVAYLPLGTLEWHGEHLPVGNDALKAHALCCRMAQEIGGLSMPPIYWGDNREEIAEVVFDPQHFDHLERDHTAEMMEAYDLSKENFLREAARSREKGGWKLFKAILTHSLHQIENLGFEVVVTVSGHYPLNGSAKEVAEHYDGESRILPIMGYDLVEDLGYKGDHAAKWETSLLLSLRPELVDLQKLRETGRLTGVMGEDPREASANYGIVAINEMIDAARRKIGTLLGQAQGK